jgi:hypothetical protein
MTDDWFEVLHVLLDADAKFLVIGAHAMAVHGVPRGTQDLDVWVEPSSENADKVWRALAGFGAPLHSIGVTLADLKTAGTVVQFGLPPNRIDVLTDISGVGDFSAAWAARREYDVHGRSVPFIGREALIANKRAAGRPKDLADLDALGELPRA